jgi:LasA protease
MQILALLAVLVLAVPPVPVAGRDPLVEAVIAALPDRAESAGTQVSVLREDPAGWAFGSAVQRARAEPRAYPYGWLWLAHEESGSWRVALEGSAGFGALAREAPLLRGGERSVLGGLAGARPEAAATDYRTGMRLPYQVGHAWRYTGGPHPMSGQARSSIDLAGGDGKVRAARDGVAYRMCDGWVRVVHDRGFATDYYHLEKAISADGKPVAGGEYLGRIGTDVCAGGSATGAHVHFSLRRDGNYVNLSRYNLGKWSIRHGARPYEGSAWHGSRRVAVGGKLHNYGALRFTEGVVDTNGGGVLNRRAGPSTTNQVVGTVKDGATVRVRCSARGTTHTGRGGYRTDLWNRLAVERAGEVGGGWVSDAYLWTGTGAPVAGWC